MGPMERNPSNASRRTPVWVRVALIVGPAAAFVALLSVALADREGVPRVGDSAPDFSAPLLTEDGTLALSELRGRPAVLNFWASWCKPCEDEAPMLQAAHERYVDEVAFVGINIKDAESDARAFVERWRIDYPNVKDEGGRIYDDYALTGQPESFFIDAGGEIVAHVPGPLFEDDLDRLLGVLVTGDG